MADSKSDTKDSTSSGGGSSLRAEQWKMRDEGSGTSATSKLVSGPPESEPKDSGNPENIIPLSPQWLLSKPGENKPPAPSGDPPRTPGIQSPGYGMNDAPGKDRWRNVEGSPHDPKRTRDWWRTISLERDADSSRRERWREEERESSNNLAPRRDRWKEGERDTVGDQNTPQAQSRRPGNERWPEMNAGGGRESSDPLRRAASDRWADTPSRESNFDSRRDNKWSNRWGPDEKEREFRGKWVGDGVDKEGGKDGMDGGGYHPRHVPNAHSAVRDGDREREKEREREREREPDTSRHDRAWRPSFASRGRGETPHLGSTPPKMAPGFLTGRGRGEPYGVGFTVGRGRGGNLQSGLLHGPPLSPIGSPFPVDKWDVGKENVFRYPRVKLLDIHRKCGILSFQKYPDGFTEVAQLTQSDPVEPMAFFQPDVDEEGILEGIRKGEIVSSGAVHNSALKDGSLNRVMRQDSLGRGRGRGRGAVGKEDSGFDGHREDDFFDQPGFGNARGGDGGAFDKLAEARFADAEESWESRARIESNLDNDVSKDESSWRRGRAGEESGPVRDDGSWRRDPGARSDGAWRKSRAGDEGAVSSNEEKLERPDRVSERDDRSSWRRPEQLHLDDSKSEHGMAAERGSGVHARRADQEATLETKDGLSVAGKPGIAEDPVLRHQGPGGVGGVEAPKESHAPVSTEAQFGQESSLQQVAPEDLCLLYTDPQGEVQGPFLGVDIIGWFEAGFFGLELPVRLMDAPEGTPFSPLENIMPHLKPAVKVPPGFNSLKGVAEEGGESFHLKGDVQSSSVSFRLQDSLGGDVELERRGSGFEPSLDMDLLGLTDTSKDVLGGNFRLGLNGRTSSSKGEMPSEKPNAKGEKEVVAKGDESGEQTYSMRKRMSAFPRVDADISETPSVDMTQRFPQNEGLGSLPGPAFSVSKASRSPSMPSDLPGMLQSSLGHAVPKDQAWGDSLMRNLSLDAQYPYVGLPPSGSGIDPTHLAQQLEQLEIQHLQRMGSTGSALQRQLSGVPPSPQSARMNLEQLMRPGGLPPRDHSGSNPLLGQIPPQPHQAPAPIPPSGPVLEQLLRMQQQQQQQQQLPTQVLIEQLLRNQSMPPPAHFDHLHRQGSGLADQLLLGRQSQDPRLVDASGPHVSGREFEQLMLARQNHTSPSPFEQLLRQRHQEDQQQQMLQFGLPVPQSHQTLEDMRVSGVWEVDEFGQFVKRTQSPAPLRTYEAFQHHQQQQQHQQRLQGQHGYPGHLQQEPQDMFGYEQSSLMDHGVMDSRVPMNMVDPNMLRRERSASGMSGMVGMDGELVAQIQEQQQRTRSERQNPLPGFLDSSGGFSDMERFHRDVFDLRQVQERQQQVEATAAARLLGLGTTPGLESQDGRPKSGERRVAPSEGPGTSALLPGLRWPIMNNEAPEKPDIVPGRGLFAPSLSMWGQEGQDYGVSESPMAGVSRSGASMSDHVPILSTPSAGETPRSSVASTPPESGHMLGNWNLSHLHSSDAVQSVDSHSHGLSASSLSQGGWKSASVPKAKSLSEIQQEESGGRAVGERSTVDSVVPSALGGGVSSSGFGPWAAPSVPQPKSLREIQEEESQKASVPKVVSPDGVPSQLSVGMFGQKSPSSRGADPPAWGNVSALEKGVSLLDAVDESVVAPLGRKSVHPDLVGLTPGSTPLASQSTPGFVDGDFIEPKESKKNKKRAAKAKSTPPGKSAVPVSASEVFPVSSPLPSSKSLVSRSVQLEVSEDSLSAPPPGPSLADFLHLGSEAASSFQPLPAWSTTPNRQARVGKSLSLKEIQEAEKRAREEQERQNQVLEASLALKTAPAPTAKPITLMTRSVSGGAAWQRPGVATPWSQPAVGGSQSRVSPSGASIGGPVPPRSKVGVFEDDDDLFWDYGHDAKLSIGGVKGAPKSEDSSFSSLVPGHGQVSRSIQSKPVAAPAPSVFRTVAAPVSAARASPADFPSLSATAVGAKASSTKAKKPASSKGPAVSAEVKALRQWCESQLKKLSVIEDVSNVDFSIVDFCISLPSVSEASDYLSQYMSTLAGVSDSQIQAFKKEFVRRKEQLPGDGNVSSSDREDTDVLGANGKQVGRSQSGRMDMARLLKEDTSGDFESSSTPGSGKKKGKKGKKVVDPSLLGFSVTSNRIMMGEIHHIDD